MNEQREQSLSSVLELIERLPRNDQRRLRDILAIRLRAEPTSPEEFHATMESEGMLTRPTPDADASHPPFEPIHVDGEPLSEQIIRERR